MSLVSSKRSLCSVRFVESMIMQNVIWIKSFLKIFLKFSDFYLIPLFISTSAISDKISPELITPL